GLNSYSASSPDTKEGDGLESNSGEPCSSPAAQRPPSLRTATMKLFLLLLATFVATELVMSDLQYFLQCPLMTQQALRHLQTDKNKEGLLIQVSGAHPKGLVGHCLNHLHNSPGLSKGNYASKAKKVHCPEPWPSSKTDGGRALPCCDDSYPVTCNTALMLLSMSVTKPYFMTMVILLILADKTTGAMDINTDPGCCRTRDPDVALVSSLNLDITMVLDGKHTSPLSLLLTTFTMAPGESSRVPDFVNFHLLEWASGDAVAFEWPMLLSIFYTGCLSSLHFQNGFFFRPLRRQRRADFCEFETNLVYILDTFLLASCLEYLCRLSFPTLAPL
ncbi:hypothetical protein STEG23_037167, partial [Scotinomys teguina]